MRLGLVFRINSLNWIVTARYAEYNSRGPGGDKTGRVIWAKQLTDEELKKFTLENILGAWKPDK